MGIERRRPTKSQATQLRRVGVDPKKTVVEYDSEAPKGREKEDVRAARSRAKADLDAARGALADLVSEFKLTNPEAAALVEEVAEAKKRLEFLESRVVRERVQIVEAGPVFHTIRGYGDTFVAAVRRIRK